MKIAPMSLLHLAFHAFLPLASDAAPDPHDGRIQKLTVHTPPNNENDFKKSYRSFGTVKSMNFIHCSACTHRFSSLNIDLTIELYRNQR